MQSGYGSEYNFQCIYGIIYNICSPRGALFLYLQRAATTCSVSYKLLLRPYNFYSQQIIKSCCPASILSAHKTRAIKLTLEESRSPSHTYTHWWTSEGYLWPVFSSFQIYILRENVFASWAACTKILFSHYASLIAQLYRCYLKLWLNRKFKQKNS